MFPYGLLDACFQNCDLISHNIQKTTNKEIGSSNLDLKNEKIGELEHKLIRGKRGLIGAENILEQIDCAVQFDGQMLTNKCFSYYFFRK